MRDIVAAPDFLERNYLSTDARIPVTQLETEICSSMASNALEATSGMLLVADLQDPAGRAM